ncbi:MAG: 8-amino-7-oxononanoate synthase [Aquabacterium sp.]|jgi:8-amino-7-oxononanoate synthase|uniref:8-amino-7-oxononanoate synthase n=1 Tax=Aquabacterium sp. TaxID=1872578 RepID=UPI002A35A2CC|nr:8-amino-7-oxononanoate synthase [Aquabacterium sp.]MDX9842829.1 8-amino-7-oxononanoate synthase [Aquabacterium sp.]
MTGLFDQELAQLRTAHLARQRRQVMPLKAPVDLSAAEEDLRGTHYLINGQARLSFGSNDYLGLSQHPAVITAAQEAAARYGVGATASPLVCGHSPAHEALENELAALVGLPRALYFYAGYAANVGIIPALVGKGDAVFSDALNHACLIDGIRLSRAELHVVPHADLAALEQALQASTAKRKLVVTDAVFSMDGNVADVPALMALCERFDAWLMIDDAHGFGVLGEHGEGTLSYFGMAGRDGVAPAWQGRMDRLIYMATLGKAAGVAGAFVAGEPSMVEWVLQKARTYMFATATPAMIAEALRASVRVMQEEGWRRDHLRALQQRLREGIASAHLPWQLMPSDTAIQPLIIGSNEAALAVMAKLDQQGVWVPAIRPPTVPEGTARLRISLSAAHTLAQVDQLVAALTQAVA